MCTKISSSLTQMNRLWAVTCRKVEMPAVHLERSSYTISINHKQAVSDSQSQYDELFISVFLEMCNKYNKFPNGFYGQCSLLSVSSKVLWGCSIQHPS